MHTFIIRSLQKPDQRPYSGHIEDRYGRLAILIPEVSSHRGFIINKRFRCYPILDHRPILLHSNSSKVLTTMIVVISLDDL